MNLTEGFSLALGNIRTNKLRSGLTMLGIIIGVGSVIALTSLGQGFSNLVNGQIKSSGSATITVIGTTGTGYPSLTMADAAALLGSPSVEDVAMQAVLTADVMSGEARKRTSVTAITPNFFGMDTSITAAEGALFTDESAQAVVLGADIAEYLFPNGGALGQTITVDEQAFEVVGVLNFKESNIPLPPGARESGFITNLLPNENNVIYVPLTAAQAVFDMSTNEAGDPALTMLSVLANSGAAIQEVNTEISTVLRAQHGLTDGTGDDFSIRSMAALADTFQVITAALTGFLGAIAGIALLVGGIGIMNIMLVSVTERTREIGIRKSMGALRRDILGQFLIEAVVLCVTGGLIGMALGWMISFMGGALLGLTIAPSLAMIVLAVGFSTVVGVVFGVYPAWKASRLPPILALRYE